MRHPMMRIVFAFSLAASCAVTFGCASTRPARTSDGAVCVAGRTGPLSMAQFRALMETIAQGWNEGDSMKSARCFAEGAVYMEPPDLRVYEGRAALTCECIDALGIGSVVEFGRVPKTSPASSRW